MPQLGRDAALEWIRRWDLQQEESLPDREDRFTALLQPVERRLFTYCRSLTDTDADARDPIVHEIRLHEVKRPGLKRLLDRDAVVADAPEDLAHRFDRLAMRRDRDLEPADGLGLSACGGRDRRSR